MLFFCWKIVDCKEMYFEFASVIQFGTLRRFANFTFHENYFLDALASLELVVSVGP